MGKERMLLSMNSTLDVFPKPGILVSTPGASEVVWVSGLYTSLTLSTQQLTRRVSICSMLSQRSYQSLVLLHQKCATSVLFSLASIWLPPSPGTRMIGWTRGLAPSISSSTARLGEAATRERRRRNLAEKSIAMLPKTHGRPPC